MADEPPSKGTKFFPYLLDFIADPQPLAGGQHQFQS